MPSLIVLLAALLLAFPAWGQSSWPADKVDFADGADLEAKVSDGSVGVNAPHVSTSEASTQTIASDLQKGSDVFWNAGNDGPGSGLDADTLDGNEASAFYSGATPLAASAYAGPVEVWLGRIKLKSDGANPALSYLQSTEVAHLGAATQIDFTNTQDDANIVITGAAGGSVFIIEIGAWQRGVGGTCQISVYENDTYVVAKQIDTASGPSPKHSKGSLALAAAATADIAVWSNSCTGTTDADWENFYRIERY